MANMPVRDADGTKVYTQATGTGAIGDPYIPAPAATITALVPGTGATNLGKAEDAAHSSGDTGVMSLGVYATTPAPTSTTVGDYVPPIMTRAGQAMVPLPAELPVNTTTGETRNSSLSSAVTLTPPSGATHVVLQATVSGKNVRLTLDGTVPTATVGFCIVALDPPIRVAVGGHTLKVIEEAASATLEIMWEGN